MSQPAIKIEQLSKQYQLGARERGYRTFREALTDALTGPFRRVRAGTSAPRPETLWALKGLNLQVETGDVLGVIGGNGAGKSTLLKVLSRITEPTSGRVEIRGRVASLLEVGTGFHPELTGRENIYLNGAILGMGRGEIHRNFDAIVAFAEVERFIDTPVKRYSSGMYLRLAFAVAAHLNPEILVVDEVLAVGDMAFQKKCLGKMHDVSQQGRTVLFVSHNMGAVKSLCNRAVLLQAGQVECEGNVHEVVDRYSTAGAVGCSDSGLIPDDLPRIRSTDDARIRSVRLTGMDGRDLSQLYYGQPFRVTVTIEVFKDIREAVFEVGVVADDGVHVTYSSNIERGNPPVYLPRGWHQVTLELDPMLQPRQYSFMVALHHFDSQTIDWVERILSFTVLNVSDDSSDSYRWGAVRGYVRPRSHWHPPEETQPGAAVRATVQPEPVPH